MQVSSLAQARMRRIESAIKREYIAEILNFAPILLRHRVGMVSEHLSDSDTVSEQYRSTSPNPILLRQGVGAVSEHLSDSDTVSEQCRSDTALPRNLSDIVPNSCARSDIGPTSGERSAGARAHTQCV